MKPFSQILEKKLILTTGKGGIGKTTVAGALATHAAALGKKVCLVESSSSDQVSPLFGKPAIGHQLSPVSQNIFAINLQPAQNFRDFIVIHLGFAKLFDRVFTKSIVRSFITMLPGVAELTLLGRLFYFSELDEKNQFDHIILDGYASGHFLALLKTPDSVLNSGMVGPVIAETKKVRDYIFDADKTAIVVVAMLEDLIVSESLDLCERLREELQLTPAAMFLNRCLPSIMPKPIHTNESVLPSNIDRYFQNKRAAQIAALNILRAGLQAPAMRRIRDFPVHMLTDTGYLPTPLTNDFVKQWLDASQEFDYEASNDLTDPDYGN